MNTFSALMFTLKSMVLVGVGAESIVISMEATENRIWEPYTMGVDGSAKVRNFFRIYCVNVHRMAFEEMDLLVV